MALFDYELPYPVAAGFRDKPLQNVMVNVGSDKVPAYAEFMTSPAFPWALAEFTKTGDGKESVYTPTGSAIEHPGESAKAYWQLVMSVGAVPLPKEANKAGFEVKDG